MAYQSNAIQGWMGAEELAWLYEKATTMRSVLEIGSWKGRSTHALLSGCSGPVFTVDHFLGNPDQRNGPHREVQEKDIFPDFWNNCGHFKNLVVLRMNSVDAATFFAPKSIDMIFLDGSHLYADVVADIQAWFPKCRKLFCGHDRYENGVPEAIEWAREELGVMWVPQEGTIWSYDI